MPVLSDQRGTHQAVLLYFFKEYLPLHLMDYVFYFGLWGAFISVRFFAHLFHDASAYSGVHWKGRNNDRSATLTGFLRRKTGIDVHHFHMGICLLFLLSGTLYFQDMTPLLAFLLGVGLSMTLDQIFCAVTFKEYLGLSSFLTSLFLHGAIVLLTILS